MTLTDHGTDRFDLLEANYVFCSDWHSGAASELYARLCRVCRILRPRPDLCYETLEEGGKEVYRRLCRRFRVNPPADLENDD
jgi:hypothetical protein